jgi:hypothetical protein
MPIRTPDSRSTSLTCDRRRLFCVNAHRPRAPIGVARFASPPPQAATRRYQSRLGRPTGSQCGAAARFGGSQGERWSARSARRSQHAPRLPQSRVLTPPDLMRSDHRVRFGTPGMPGSVSWRSSLATARGTASGGCRFGLPGGSNSRRGFGGGRDFAARQCASHPDCGATGLGGH